MKKILTVSVATLSLVTLMAGCGRNKQSQPRVVKETTKKADVALWSKKKDQKLAQFITKWEKTMNQEYTKYDGHHALKTAAGMTYPADLKTATVKGKTGHMTWYKKGKGTKGYNVVALYNYDQSDSSSITYAFTIKNGEPIVLVNQGQENDWVPTKNDNLQDNFANIVEGRATKLKKVEKEEAVNEEDSSSSKSSQTSASANSSKGDDAHDDERDGYVTTPVAMRGTWYAKNEYGSAKIVVTDHQIMLTDGDGETYDYVLYRRKGQMPDPGTVTSADIERTKSWASAMAGQVHGMDTINIRGWYQSAGAGSYYSAHTEEVNGQKVPVVVSGSGAGAWVDAVFYPSEAMANSQGATQYSDLQYR